MSDGSNQRTLFQTWGPSVTQNKAVQPKKRVNKTGGLRKTTPSSSAQVPSTQTPLHSSAWTVVDQGSTPASEKPVRQEDSIAVYDTEENDDDLILDAVYEAERSLQPDVDDSQDVETESIAIAPLRSGGQNSSDFADCDITSAKVWIYPTNYPIREYQLKISEAALSQNTLVCLPTGLGKTFIASVVMYNFYRWFPVGKIVFMAPTKPLVAQQIEACYRVMGIPQAHMAELTGNTAAKQRQEVWRTKRVFFLTPQVMVNDLLRDTCPAQQVKCVVIDEAHKALGNHAYCQVIRQLGSQNQHIRILALSATPGADIKSIQSVISNLLISHIELRSEESPDIQAHSHQRSVEKVVVPLGEALSGYQARYLQVLEKLMYRLVQNRVMAHKDLRNLTKYQLILARDQFRKNPPPHLQGLQQGMLEGDFALCITLCHGYELLVQMGLRSLFFYIQGLMDGTREMPRAKKELEKIPIFMDLYYEMKAIFMALPAGPDEPFIYGHPKLEKLEEVVLQHFSLRAESTTDPDGMCPQAESSRVIIFSSFRESVQEIAAMLDRHAPLIKVMTFMGQASAGKGVKGFTQKQQLEVVLRFRQGGFNTLVSTCVGEEGLDIGEVDLIVCFDAQKNPIRLVQRMGRTGRKRRGRIVVILAEGREDRTYNQSQSKKHSVYKSITSNKNRFHMYPNSPRMLPEGVHPSLHKMHITCEPFDLNSRRSIRSRGSYSGGRASLTHPQNQIRQGRLTSPGFLRSVDSPLRTSSLRLVDQEAQPALKQSFFTSICSNAPSQEALPEAGPPTRELSLWEWRHWQHKALPFHAVDHSLGCRHFVRIMELIDEMKDENEDECGSKPELLPCFKRRDTVKSAQKKEEAPKITAKTTNNQCEASGFEQELNEEESQPSDGLTEQKLFVEPNCESAHDDTTVQPRWSNACPAAHIEDRNKDKLETMFYFPKWDLFDSPIPDEVLPVQDECLKDILANVAELLSRSPSSLPDVVYSASLSHPPSSQQPHPLFPVTFNLLADDDADDEAMLRTSENSSPRPEREEPVVNDKATEIRLDWSLQRKRAGTMAADSPTWDDVFDDKEIHHIKDIHGGDTVKYSETCCDEPKGIKGNISNDSDNCGQVKSAKVSQCGVHVNESENLFNDEAFMQVSIPDVSTPETGVTFWTFAAGSRGKLSETAHRLSSTSHTELTSGTKLFPVTFDLCYSLEDSEDEAEVEAASPNCMTPSSTTKPKAPMSASPAAVFSTPLTRQRTSPPNRELNLSTPGTLSEIHMPKYGALPSPITSSVARRMLTPGLFELPSSSSKKRQVGTSAVTSDSEDEGFLKKRKLPNRVNPLSSPQVSKLDSDVDSPVAGKRKRPAVLDTSDEAGAISDDDFQRDSRLVCMTAAQPARHTRTKHTVCWKDYFLDEEAELSEDEECAVVSSDEEEGKELNQFLDGFVVDNTHVSQGLDDSEMHAVYLKSIRSPAARGKFKLSYRNNCNRDVFSQVPEMDETYAEDSFVVANDVVEADSSEEEAPQVELSPEALCVDGRRQYTTRRRARAVSAPAQSTRNKHTRIIRIDDSSEEEERSHAAGGGAVAPSRQRATITFKESMKEGTLKLSGSEEDQNDRSDQRFENQCFQLDLMEPETSFTPKKTIQDSTWTSAEAPPPSGPVRILVDSRCISSGAELLMHLRQRHAATVHVCSLDSGYFIISNRMAVERHSQTDLGSMHSQKWLAERVSHLQGLFERVCLLVEVDHTNPGEVSRSFKLTHFYNSTLTALVRAGVHVLWSNGSEESAGLLMDLALLEQRKGQGIAVPLEVKGQRRELALQLYLSLPSISYAHALNLSHRFSSIAQLINSSAESIQKGGCMSSLTAKKIHRFLHYSCHAGFLSASKAGKLG